MKVSVFCANKDISKIQVGQGAILSIDGASEEINGVVTSVSHVADCKTRNYEVEVKISNHDLKVADGITVNGKIAVGITGGFFIPSSCIVLSDDGAPGIKIIVDKNRVKFVPIKIVSTQNDGAWVSGPDMGDLKLITIGHEYVVDGAEVAAVPE
jgi:multidrug efflux system membrane fusion protein